MNSSNGIALQLLTLSHRDELFRLVDSNRDYLRKWLPWLDVNTEPGHTEAFLQSVVKQYESGRGPQYAVFCNSVMCGVCGFHPINSANKVGEIGYWLAENFSGRGIMTMAVQALVAEGFRDYGLHQIEIACATGNVRSRAIPKRLGFTFEGVLRERECLYGKYVDHAIYSMLAREHGLARDFYLDQKGLAAYFEMQWFDKLRVQGFSEPLCGESGTVPDSFIASDYNLHVASFVADALHEHDVLPGSVLEVGPALGRNSYELIRNFPGIHHMTVVEPSQNLLANFRRILIEGAGIDFPFIKGLRETGSVKFNTAPLAAQCRHVTFDLIDVPFAPKVVTGHFDLVVCLNVLDQCESPRAIIEGLMQATAPFGVLIVSCSYQWSRKHMKDMNEAVSDINSYFDSDWLKLAETEHEYKVRFNDRHANLFLSHAVIYRKVIYRKGEMESEREAGSETTRK